MSAGPGQFRQGRLGRGGWSSHGTRRIAHPAVAPGHFVQVGLRPPKRRMTATRMEVEAGENSSIDREAYFSWRRDVRGGLRSAVARISATNRALSLHLNAP